MKPETELPRLLGLDNNLVRMDHDSSENLIGGEKLEMTTCLLEHFLGNKHLKLRIYWYSVAPRGEGGGVDVLFRG